MLIRYTSFMNNRLPIYHVIDKIHNALKHHSRAILRADPGAGKSTVVPLELLDAPWLSGQKILILEPRRLAARMVAERMAQSLGESPGERVGYRMRGAVRSGKRTRIEVITEGLFTRILRNDPALEKVGLVIFDEFHERSLQNDLGLALTLQAQELLREDLRILVMSATLDREALRALLGGSTPIIESEGRAYPVTIRHLPPNTPAPSVRELPARMAAEIRQALAAEAGSLLAFLPGASEIRCCAELLRRGADPDWSIVPLYGALSPEEQRRAIRPAPPGRRKIVLATNIAETSLTIEGIRIVVDGGYERQVRYDASRGMNRMETLPVSADSATQRAGRAGRMASGVAYRLWSETRPLLPHIRPEILRADLATLVLELAAWGAEALELAWIDSPPDHALVEARRLLQKLEMLDESGVLTPLGDEALKLGEHPRIAHMLLRAVEMGLGYEAALLAAILSERPSLESSDLQEGAEEVHRRLREADPAFGRLSMTLRRTLGVLGLSDSERLESQAVGMLIALAYPERIAWRRDQRNRYRSAGGRGMRLRQGDRLERYPLLAVAEAGGEGSEAIIHLAAPLRREELERVGLVQIREAVTFNDESGRVEARKLIGCDAIILESRPLPRPEPEIVAEALLEGIRGRGLDVLPWSPRSRRLRQRVLCARYHLGESWPDWRDETLTARLEAWLLPWIEGMASIDDLGGLDLAVILETWLGWERKTELDRLLPPAISLPAGGSVPLDYSDPEHPVLAARLQELFGWSASPRILEGRLPLTIHLLSPARRPLAITRDLESFWREVYPEVRKEMRGRYPKHYWPEDPLTAEATSGTKKQMQKRR